MPRIDMRKGSVFPEDGLTLSEIDFPDNQLDTESESDSDEDEDEDGPRECNFRNLCSGAKGQIRILRSKKFWIIFFFYILLDECLGFTMWISHVNYLLGLPGTLITANPLVIAYILLFSCCFSMVHVLMLINLVSTLLKFKKKFCF